jgi:hypothetical protein
MTILREIRELLWSGHPSPEYSWHIALLMMATGLLLSSSRYRAQIISVAASVVISVNVVAALIYFVLPQYSDHIEPHVVITALNAHQGLPLYPDWSQGEGAYGMLYGPFLYAAVGLPLFASKSVIASKLVTSTAFLFATAAMWCQGRRSSTPSAGLIAKIHLLALIPFGFWAFWVRSEPLLLALAAGGVMVIQIRSDTLRWLALGVFAGLATAIKIHAALYFIPLGVFALVRASDAKAAILCAATGAAGFIAALVAAFAASPHEAVNFGRYVATMSRHGLSEHLLFVNLLAALALTAPYGILLWQRRASLGRDWSTVLTAASMALTVALVILVGAKPASGPRHLMPLIPVLLFLTLTGRGPKVIEANDPSPILAAAMIAAALSPLATTAVFLRSAVRGIGDTLTAYREAADLTALYPGAQFGPTDMDHYHMLQNRVGAALRGARLTFDVAAWMDLEFAGIRPSDDAADFSPGPLVWILPRDGAPFSQYSWYNRAMFSPAFQTNFQSRCQQVDVRTTFTAWRCEAGLLDAVGRNSTSTGDASR